MRRVKAPGDAVTCTWEIAKFASFHVLSAPELLQCDEPSASNKSALLQLTQSIVARRRHRTPDADAFAAGFLRILVQPDPPEVDR